MNLNVAKILRIDKAETFVNSKFVRFFSREEEKYNIVVFLHKNVATETFMYSATGKPVFRGHKKGNYVVEVSKNVANKYEINQQLSYEEFKKLVPEQNYTLKTKK